MKEAQEQWKAKYADLVAEWVQCIDVGCCVFGGKSLHGVLGLQRQKDMKNIKEASEKASLWLWLRSGDVGIVC